MSRTNRIMQLAIIIGLVGGCSTLNSAVHLNKSAELYGKGEYQAAIAEATKAIEAKPDFHLAYLNRAVISSAARQYDSALRDYDVALRLKPDEAITHLNYVELLTLLRRRDDAVRHAESFLRAHPTSPLGKLTLAGALEEQKSSQRAFQLTSQALSDLEGPQKSAEELKHVPRDYLFAYAYGLHARAAASLGKSAEAQQAAAKAATFREDIGVAYTRAKIHYNQRTWQEVIRVVESAHAKATIEERDSTVGIESKFLLGNAALQAGDLPRARQAYRDFLSANQHEPEAFFNLGQVEAKSGNAGGAIEHYTVALRLNESLADAYVNRGTLYLQAQRYDDAAADFTKLLAANPHDGPLLYKRAYSYCAAGKYALGEQDLRTLLQADAGNAEARELLKQCGTR